MLNVVVEVSECLIVANYRESAWCFMCLSTKIVSGLYSILFCSQREMHCLFSYLEKYVGTTLCSVYYI